MLFRSSFKYVATPKAIVTIEESNIMYVITFGSSYFLVDKFCDRKFAFEFAKRSEYKDIKTTALNSPNSLKNKVINSYNKCSELIYDSGESYSKIKASMKTQEEETRFNGTIEIGTSIKFSMKENTLENIIKIIEYVEETLEKEIIHNIPLFLEVDKFRVEELDKKLIENITQGNTNVKFAEFDIIGTNEIFYNNDTKMKICYGKNAEETEEINCEKLNNFISTYKVEHSNVLDIKIETTLNNNQFDSASEICQEIDELLMSLNLNTEHSFRLSHNSPITIVLSVIGLSADLISISALVYNLISKKFNKNKTVNIKKQMKLAERLNDSFLNEIGDDVDMLKIILSKSPKAEHEEIITNFRSKLLTKLGDKIDTDILLYSTEEIDD